jgi:4-hydroxy-tetrahydrodipicolinate reductase
MKYAREIAKHLPHVEIIEKHHELKADSPSGTAIRAAEMISESVKQANPGIKPSKETIPGSRGATLKGIPIHAVRLPGMLAHLEVVFGSPGETVTLRHDTIDRQCFMPGVCLACEKVIHLDKLLYGLEELL